MVSLILIMHQLRQVERYQQRHKIVHKLGVNDNKRSARKSRGEDGGKKVKIHMNVISHVTTNFRRTRGIFIETSQHICVISYV